MGIAPLLLAAAVVAQDPVRVGATVSARDLRVGETVVLQILVETGGEEPDRIHLPDLPRQLEMVGRAESRALSAGSGGRRREVRVDVTLLARLPGRVVIPPATVVIGGVTHRTAPLPITIDGTAPTPDPQPPPLGWEGAELRAWLHPDTVYVGQQALLQVEARIPEGMRRGRARPLSYEPPSPTGFWVHDLPDAGVTVLRSIGDRIIEVQSFQRAYFALEPGTWVMPPARVTYEVRRGFLQPPENQLLQSDSLRLVVQPLPAVGRPDAFRGAVGSYAVRAWLEPERVAIGDIASLVVEIEGEGNIKTLAAPTLPALDNVEVHEPSENAAYSTPAGRLSGTKRFRWLLVPRARGALEIPPIRFAWFDAEAGEYRESETEPLRLEVVPGGVIGDATLAPIDRAPRPAPSSVPPAWLLLLLPPLVIVAGAAIVRHRRISGPSPARAWRDALAEAATQATPGRTAWAASVASTVREAAGAASGEAGLRGASPAELATALRRSGVRRELADEAGSLVGELERLRFEPGAEAVDTETLFVRARRLVDALAKGARTLLVLLALVAGAAPVVAQSSFAAAVEAYDAGRFGEAADSFASHLSSRPFDAAAWYDLGNAAYRANAPGRAAQAWLRALWLEPRHGAARANLRLNMPAAAAAAPPRTLLAGRTAFLVMGVAWWVALLAFAAHLLRPRPALTWTVGAAAAAALLAVVLATSPRLLAPDAVSLDETPLQPGPMSASPAPERLQPGVPLDVLEESGDWVRVRDPAGREGWIEARHAGRLHAASP